MPKLNLGLEGYIQDISIYGVLGPVVTRMFENIGGVRDVLGYGLRYRDKVDLNNSKLARSTYLITPDEYRELKKIFDRVIPVFTGDITTTEDVNRLRGVVLETKLASHLKTDWLSVTGAVFAGLLVPAKAPTLRWMAMILGGGISGRARTHVLGMGWTKDLFLQACQDWMDYSKIVLAKRRRRPAKDLSKSDYKMLNATGRLILKILARTGRGYAHVIRLSIPGYHTIL